MEKVILASNSPRRKELFSLFGWPFTVIPANLDETRLPLESPEGYVRRLALQKAGEVAMHEQGLVIAADTIVVDGDDLLGKPVDETDARRMLKQLRGRSHQVYTGIAITDSEGKYNAVCLTGVPMRDYTDPEIEAYIASGDPMDKAGAYGIQHAGFHPVAGLTGCFASVMGFPLCHVVVGLRVLGFDVQEDIPEKCQRLLDYSCPVYGGILGKV
jgi:septum formation protein